MKFLIIGLGSMGKRRIRCLNALGISKEKIYGHDIREDRKKEAKDKYGINIINSLDESVIENIDAFIISTPPDKHNEYMNLAIKNNKPAFVEASVILEGLEEINKKAKEKNVLIAPSCTMLFHPIIKDIKEIIDSNILGKITNFSYHSGQYLPDWHPWEDIKDFYVSKRETGGAREIVPFELTWIVDVIGFPKAIKGYFGKTTDLGVDIDDSYAISMDFGNCLGTLLVDVVARHAIRILNMNFENGYIYWNWDEGKFRLYDAKKERWVEYYQPEGKNEIGYNKNIIEDMYIEEIRAFIKAVEGVEDFPNNLDKDIKVLKLLQEVEGGVLP